MIELESERLARGVQRYSLRNAAEFKESDHPRGEDGKFGSGGSKSKEKKDIDKKEKITSLNPTGSIYAEYTPEQRMEMDLGENITTLAETAGESPDKIVTVYRGISTGKGSISGGDFVTTNKQLAKDYAGTGSVVSMDVRLGDILDDKDEPMGEEYIYYPNKTKKENSSPKQIKVYRAPR